VGELLESQICGVGRLLRRWGLLHLDVDDVDPAEGTSRDDRAGEPVKRAAVGGA
jgi:hypothetical protein